MEEGKVSIGVIDYAVLAILLSLCTVIGLLSGRKKGGQTVNIEQYLLGNRKMKIVPIAFSMMATNLSGVTMAGVTAEMYVFGLQYMISFFSYSLGMIPVAHFIVPIIHKHRYVSIYEYMERRFDRKLRLIFSISYLVGTMLFLGVVLYIPAVSMSIVSGIPTHLAIFIIGASCTVYCVFGGFQAVVATDVIQSLIAIATLILFVLKGTMDAGGVGQLYNKSLKTEYLQIRSWFENFDYRYSAISIICMGFYYTLKDTVLNQSGAQRFLSLKNMHEAQKSAYVSCVITLIFCTLLGLCGVVMYVNFYDCNPLMIPEISGVKSMDQMFSYAIVKFLHVWPGMSGFALAGILCSSISTLSSYINAFAAITLEDFMKSVCPGFVQTQKRQVLVCKVLTAVYGFIAVAFAYVIPLMGGAAKAGVTSLAVTAGPMCGVMLLGMFCKRASAKAAFIGLWIGMAVCLTFQIGNLITKPQYKTTVLTTENCHFYNETLDNSVARNTSSFNERKTFPLFRISFPWFGPIGLVVSLISGYFISFIYGEKNVDISLLSSAVVKNKKGIKNGTNTTSERKQLMPESIHLQETVL